MCERACPHTINKCRHVLHFPCSSTISASFSVCPRTFHATVVSSVDLYNVGTRNVGSVRSTLFNIKVLYLIIGTFLINRNDIGSYLLSFIVNIIEPLHTKLDN